MYVFIDAEKSTSENGNKATWTSIRLKFNAINTIPSQYHRNTYENDAVRDGRLEVNVDVGYRLDGKMIIALKQPGELTALELQYSIV